MATIKLSSSKKSVMFIDDRGFVFTLPVKSVMALCSGRIPKGFLTLSMAPFRLNSSRFPASPVYVDGETRTLSDAVEDNLVDISFYDSVGVKDDTFTKISNLVQKPSEGRKVKDVKL